MYQKFVGQTLLQIGVIWYTILLELNFINMIIMLYTYKKSTEKR